MLLESCRCAPGRDVYSFRPLACSLPLFRFEAFAHNPLVFRAVTSLKYHNDEGHFG